MFVKVHYHVEDGNWVKFSYCTLFCAYIVREDEKRTLNNNALEVRVSAMHRVILEDGCLNPLIIVKSMHIGYVKVCIMSWLCNPY
jgi:hypothetical protein